MATTATPATEAADKKKKRRHHGPRHIITRSSMVKHGFSLTSQAYTYANQLVEALIARHCTVMNHCFPDGRVKIRHAKAALHLLDCERHTEATDALIDQVTAALAKEDAASALKTQKTQ